jgi:hypothetical protein
LRRAGCCTCGRARQGTRAGGRRGDRDNDRVACETRLTVEQLGQLAEVADRQAARLAAAADVIGAELGEERAGPSFPRTGPAAMASFDRGIEAACRELRELFRDQRHAEGET